MVACFCYASIDVHSVYLPPSKLEFDSYIQEWIQKEADEVHNHYSGSDSSCDIRILIAYGVIDSL